VCGGIVIDVICGGVIMGYVATVDAMSLASTITTDVYPGIGKYLTVDGTDEINTTTGEYGNVFGIEFGVNVGNVEI